MEKKAKVYLSDVMTDADKAKMKAFRLANERNRADFITSEWQTVCELGFFYGYKAIESFLNDEISIAQMNTYIDGARKIHARHIYDTAIAVRAGMSNGKDFAKLMSPYLNEMKEVR